MSSLKEKKKYREEAHAVDFGAKNLKFLKNIKVVPIVIKSH
jgi:hypothetical protein